MESSNDKLTSILEKYPAVFSPGLGSLEGSKVKIHVKDNAQPRFHKARSVPYILRAKVEEEHDNLQKEKVISPIQFSEWAALIVAVVKRSGGMYICGDYKLTINQASHVETYPLPKVKDLFAGLAGGQTFTKLDLAQAYDLGQIKCTSKASLCRSSLALAKACCCSCSHFHLVFLQSSEYSTGVLTWWRGFLGTCHNS